MVALAALAVIGFALVSSNATPVATPSSPTATLTPSANGIAQATRTPFPTLRVSPPPTCDLPVSLPPAPASVATPAVRSSVSMIFESPFYTGTGAALAPRGTGVWLYAAGSAAPRLLAGMDADMGPEAAMPLALSAHADAAAVWWQPRQYAQGQAPCQVGIYLASMTTGSSRLLASDAWTGWGVGPDPQSDCSTGSDGQGGVANRLRGASFSADGRWLAVVECARIRIFGPDATEPPIEHLGACTEWAWSPAATDPMRFVASCEDMTSAWLVDARENGGSQTESIALPLPSGGFGWGNPGPSARAIGLTTEGEIRVLRFFGAPVGCEGVPCGTFPPFAYAVTTIPPWDADGEPVVRSDVVGFLVDSTRLSRDAEWVYVETDSSGPRIVNFQTSAITGVKSIGDPAGTPAAGALLFGSDLDATGVRVVWSLDAVGTRAQVATIGWPASRPTDFGGESFITVLNLQVAPPA